MKTNLLLMLTALMLSVSGCRVNLGDVAETIEPSENIAKAKYPQTAFDKVDSRVVGNIQLVQSDQSRVTLSAPENYIDFFEFENENGELEINYKKDNVSFKGDNITIIIYTPTLKKIKNSGAADIRMDSLTTDELDIENSGVGTFDLTKIKAHKVDVKCSGVGSITLSGEAVEAELRCSGVGNINAKNLKANEVDANVSGVGGIECFASESIKGSVSGVGGLQYAGHPAKKDLHHSMTGGITEL
jgi:hypothetical protein